MGNMFYYGRQPGLTRSMNVTRNGRNTVTVEGVGRIEVEPNQAMIEIGVVTEDMDLLKAQNDNTEKMNNIIDGLMNLGIDEDNIKTIQYNIYPKYDYIDGKQELRGYEVRHIIEVQVDDINKIGNVIESAVENGANIQQRITLTIDNSELLYEKALQLAVNNAQVKAMDISVAIDSALIEMPIKIVEKTSTDLYRTTGYYSAKDGEGAPIQTGKITIESRVEAVFEYYS